MYLWLYVVGGDVWPGSHSPLSKWRRKKGRKCKRIIFFFLQECEKKEKELFLPHKENVLAANSVHWSKLIKAFSVFSFHNVLFLFSVFICGCCAEECFGGCQKCPEEQSGAGTNRRTHWLGTTYNPRCQKSIQTQKKTQTQIQIQIKIQIQFMQMYKYTLIRQNLQSKMPENRYKHRHKYK